MTAARAIDGDLATEVVQVGATRHQLHFFATMSLTGRGRSSRLRNDSWRIRRSKSRHVDGRLQRQTSDTSSLCRSFSSCTRPPSPHYEGNYEEYQEYNEEDLCDPRGVRGDTSEAEYGCDESDDQEENCPSKHLITPAKHLAKESYGPTAATR